MPINPPIIPSILQSVPASDMVSMSDYLWLFDNFDGRDPLRPLFNSRQQYKCEHALGIFLVKGHLLFTVNQEEMSMHDLQGMFLMPGTRLKFLSASPDIKYSFYIISESWLRAIHADVGMGFKLPSLRYFTRTHDIAPEELDFRLELYQAMKSEMMRSDHPFKELMVRSYADVIFINNFDLFNYQQASERQSVSRQHLVYNNFLQLLDKYSTKERSVQFYADRLGITAKYLSALSINSSGKNASSWIDQYVVNNAINMMKEQTYTIKEISERLNFPSQSFFGRFFKRVVGISPKGFVQKYGL